MTSLAGSTPAPTPGVPLGFALGELLTGGFGLAGLVFSGAFFTGGFVIAAEGGVVGLLFFESLLPPLSFFSLVDGVSSGLSFLATSLSTSFTGGAVISNGRTGCATGFSSLIDCLAAS